MFTAPQQALKARSKHCMDAHYTYCGGGHQKLHMSHEKLITTFTCHRFWQNNPMWGVTAYMCEIELAE